jgi:hypothetical protein
MRKPEINKKSTTKAEKTGKPDRTQLKGAGTILTPEKSEHLGSY